jgi:hypothetical protein
MLQKQELHDWGVDVVDVEIPLGTLSGNEKNEQSVSSGNGSGCVSRLSSSQPMLIFMNE